MNKLELLKKKIKYRASYRGTKEMDILLTSFVNSVVDDFVYLELLKLDEFLNLNDEEVAPWIFFCYHKESERIINMLIDNGISASMFPTLPEDVFNSPNWKEENKMYRESIALPVHQDVSKTQIDKMIQLIVAHA